MSAEVGAQQSVMPVPPRRTPPWWRGFREALLIFGLWLFYSAGRNLADQDQDAAHARAVHILHAERYLHIDLEHWLNHLTIGWAWLSVPMDYWYAALHYTVTPAVLVYVYVRHRHDYSRVRNALVIACAVALVCYIFLPTEPPRLAGLGFADTMARYHEYGWWTEHASAPRGMQALTNEYAAMPSLHVGWTLWVAWALWRRVGRTGHVLSVLYVVGTTVVVLATANHWVLDIVAGLALVWASILLVDRTPALSQDDGFAVLAWRGWARLRQGRGTSATPDA